MKRYTVRLAAVSLAAALLSSCGGGGGGTMPPGGGGNGGGNGGGGGSSYTQADFTCPSSDSTSSVRVGMAAGEAIAARPAPRLPARAFAPGLVAVSYDRAYSSAHAGAISSREASLGAQEVRAFDYPLLGRSMRVLHVTPGSEARLMSSLRSQPGVVGVSQVGYRHPLTVSAPYFPNDPYFKGFAGSSAPLYETSSIPGQWDAHVTKLAYAFAYSQSADYAAANPNALGSSSVAIATIDTGQDTAHPELAGKIARQRCYLTNPSGVQSTSDFTTDPQGHGTDTAGIAAENSGNGVGFTGAGGNVVLFGYRVFPTPDSYTTCSNPNSTDPSCAATTADIASAIDDAVTAGAKVISMSLGGSPCTTPGVDPDPTEGAAVAGAIAHDVVVVAAAGNEGQGSLDAPACDSGVIAVGATGLDDGSPNGTNASGGNAGGTSSHPVEYVASYSNYESGASNNTVRSASSWGIVAPGGDPYCPTTSTGDCGTTADDLHWIENIWPANADLYSSQDDGSCESDYPADNQSGTIDCRILIAGTSMATPRVAGAAALLISVDPALASPTAMKAALCDYADDLKDPSADPHQGCGRLDVYASMAHAVNDPSPPTPTP
ncbi:MAG: S8 family peptidase [Candidatus Tyrphobacter sp.]